MIPYDLAYMSLDIAEDKMPYEAVRAWFAAHLAPISRRPWPPR